MARATSQFALKEQEAAVLKCAAAELAEWRRFRLTVERRTDPTRIASAGRAAGELVKVLEELERTPELSGLVHRMQELESMQYPQSTYHDRLQDAWDVLQLLQRACADLASTGRPADEFQREWVRCAARHWNAAGMAVKAQGRFGKALAAPGLVGVPTVTDRRLISDALSGF